MDSDKRRAYRRSLYARKRQLMLELGMPVRDRPGRPPLHATDEEALAAARASRCKSGQRLQAMFKQLMQLRSIEAQAVVQA